LREAQKAAVGKTVLYSIVGVIVKISVEKSFYYLACKQCKRKVVEEEGKYNCKNCTSITDNCDVSYSFSMRVEDGTGGIWISAAGDTATRILSKSAEEVKKMKDTGGNWQKIFNQQKNRVSIKKILEMLYEGKTSIQLL